MILAGGALAMLLERCAPNASVDTMAAIVSVESAGDEFALNDNTLRRPFHPPDRATAIRLAETLIGRGDSVDVGIAQVNSANFARFGVTPAQMLEPCRNLSVGSSILAADYRTAAARFTDPRAALWHAVMAYNTGSLYAGEGYVRLVVAAATRAPVVPSIALLTGRPDSLPAQPLPRPHPAKPRLTPTPDLGLGYSVPLTLSRSNPL